ncbi:hypothetical protein LTR97_007223 [Elasticomyces elasticus]|uniref:PNPLA domain-containing protein n=1 Tax=Elasticomyces elasticus TaxID=574655 RepID=A0AAN7W229_9PEZI|nr:hypothetical protein LTR97_007223 [Elasticomyces elasticus]KAK5713641.1 hypothetical protein LTR15_011341 [Elasticomyces elasticus]
MAIPHLRLLCLDGGGVRGLASLYVLKQLLSYVGDEKPCTFFDMIAGTSTGGLIAIMLGCLEMSVDECIEAYIQTMGTIFQGKRKLAFSISGQLRPRYMAEELELAVKDIIASKGFSRDALMRRDATAAAPKCRTLVVAMSEDSTFPDIFTNYKKLHEQSDFYDKVKIWEAARATSAAPSFFAPVEIDEVRYVDGGLLANNPVNMLWEEARNAWSEYPIEDQVRCLVSLGTGKPALRAFGTSLKAVGRSLIDIVTQTDHTAEAFFANHAELAQRNGYFRFNPTNLDEVGIDEAGKRGLIRSRTAIYARDSVIKDSMCRFQLIARNEPRQVLLRDSARPEPSRLFYALGKQSQHIRGSVHGYWQHLTLKSYQTYESIALNCLQRSEGSRRISFSTFLQMFNQPKPTPQRVEAVWVRLLHDDSDNVLNTQHSVPFVMAVLYMLHVEQFWPDKNPGELDAAGSDRREALKRYNRWVPCRCKVDCGREWNFANDIGLSKGGNSKKTCDVNKYLVSAPVLNLLAFKTRKALEDMNEEWAKARALD